MPTRYQLLADGILVAHILIVVLNVAALPVIWIGYARGWNFVRNFYFRVTHLALIGFIAFEALVGWACPLTTWEDELRFKATGQTSYESGFIVHWLQSLLFHDWPLWVFTVSYVGFFALVLATYFWLKPRPRRQSFLILQSEPGRCDSPN